MKNEALKVKSNICLNDSVWELTLKGVTAPIVPGQFVEVAVDGFYLRRPFGAADAYGDSLTILYRVQGAGTRAMTGLVAGDTLDCLTSLGNGFTLTASNPILLGGGMGIAPLYYLAKAFNEAGNRPKAILGFKNAAEMFYVNEFSKVADVTIATDDGSEGVCGNVLTALDERGLDGYVYACGPEVMLRAVAKRGLRGEMSLEARMGCGFGACMGCSIQTVNGPKRVCKEGPVFSIGEVIF